MTIGLYATSRGYQPGLLVVLGFILVAVGVLALVFPHWFSRVRARGWPRREVKEGEVRLDRVRAIGFLIAGAICLVIALVRALTG
ncbi:hypothetical protein ACEXQE_06850 [Herbiconiux sp. P17]|uniref:hypothetical protein n=1 Tax=Herbiconiux wuyangfengii TaxID=3342794 RepID=UPI0035B7CCA0